MCINPRKMIINGEEVTVKCGKCLICKQQRASDWTIKLINESKYYKKSCFITLTFDNKKLIDVNSKAYKFGANASFLWNLDNSKKYLQKFIKRLRKHYKNTRIKYFRIGEYGDKNKRPHYHMIIFGINFEEDRKQAEVSKTGKIQYISPTLEQIWACGRTRITDVNSRTIAYVAQYSVKKLKESNQNQWVPIKYNKETNAWKWEYKYKPKMSFSNRAKFNAKWIRKRPEQIEKGYLTDEEQHKYKIPRSYIETLKNSDYTKHQLYYQIYEDNLQKHLLETDNKLNKMIEKNKEKILQNKIRKNPRADF